MHLVLHIENSDVFEQPFDTSRALGDGILTIGRGEKADWRLPDKSRFLSSVHCRIEQQQGRFVLTDLSQNGVTLRGERIGEGETAELRNGDELVLGPFIMRATVLPGALPVSDGQGDRTIIAAASPIAPNPVDILIRPVAKEAPPAPPLRPAAKQPKPKPAADPYGSDLVAHFATAAGIDPDRLAGRTDVEFVRELGEIMRAAVTALAQLRQSGRDLRRAMGEAADEKGEDHDRLDEGDPLLALLQSGRAVQLARDVSEEILDHDRVLFPALQSALFQLLNDVAPPSIESRVGTGFLKSRKAKCWDSYVEAWDGFSAAGHNGVLDVLLMHLNDAYQAKLRNE